MNQTRAVITAAGASSRMGSPKALLRWGDQSLLAGLVATVRASKLGDPLVILGAGAAEIEPEARRLDLRTLLNPDHRKGRFTSIRLAARWARPASLLLWPVDCPAVCRATIVEILRHGSLHPEANIVPTFEGRGGHPVLLCPPTVCRLADAGDDENLRDLISRAPGGSVRIETDDPAILDNLNTPEQYRAFLAHRSPRTQGRST